MPRTAAAACLVACLVAVLPAAPAAAAPGGSPVTGQVGGGAEGGSLSARAVEVRVVLTGNGAPGGGSAAGGGAVRTVSKPPACWWDGPEYDAAAFRDAKNDPRGRTVGSDSINLPPVELVEELAAEDGSWYLLLARTDQGYDLAGSTGDRFSYTDEAARCRQQLRAGATGGPDSEWVFVPAGEDPPAPPDPVVTADELRQIAEEAIEVPDPVVGRNPQARGFVRLASWLWVEDGPSPADGFVPVEITATAGASSATVRAAPNRFSARSTTGDVVCDAAAATTPWTPGAPEGGGCQLVPERSSASSGSADGWPVTATTSYGTSWEGVTDGGPPEGGDLGLLTRDDVFPLPVAEVQSLVGAPG